jgi:hypothetical protein
MRIHSSCKILLGTAAPLALAACGGGGGSGLASLPPPPVSEPPPPDLSPQQVTIFASPTPQTFASVGVSATETGSGATLGFSGLSSANADQAHIRYASGGYYEIEMPGASWEKLGFAQGVIPADPSQAMDFQPESEPQTGAHLLIRNSRNDGYQYSELGLWYDGSQVGELAFGAATPSGQVPTTGSATYDGVVHGMSDVVVSDAFDGSFRAPVDGSVQLSFDFAKGSLDGSMTLFLTDGLHAVALGTSDFTNTAYSAGSTSYSGQFVTSAAGQNYFLGQFTGPNAEETIGAWALPFQYGGNAHQAFGAWIAK